MEFKDIVFSNSLPTKKFIRNSTQTEIEILIYDKILLKFPKIKKWILNFDYSYGVTGGESLKDLGRFEKHVVKIINILPQVSRHKLNVIALGGGSIGDFAGFFASVYQRGTNLTHIPSTWLSAIDSAHGGKTALNVGVFKNQIGTFYQAKSIFIVQEVLKSQPLKDSIWSISELLKAAIIDGNDLFERLIHLKNINQKALWTLLPLGIQVKYNVIRSDLFETKNKRIILNFGHTFGHIIELTQNIPHGKAVAIGMDFSLKWSIQKNILNQNDGNKIIQLLSKILKFDNEISKMKQKQALKINKHLDKIFMTDKKSISNHQLNFVFCKKPGEMIVDKISFIDFKNELLRQGWIS